MSNVASPLVGDAQTRLTPPTKGGATLSPRTDRPSTDHGLSTIPAATEIFPRVVEVERFSVFIDPPLARLLQGTFRGRHQLSTHRALADPVTVGEVFDGLLILADAEAVDELLVDAGLAPRRRLELLTASTRTRPCNAAEELIVHDGIGAAMVYFAFPRYNTMKSVGAPRVENPASPGPGGAE